MDLVWYLSTVVGLEQPHRLFSLIIVEKVILRLCVVNLISVFVNEIIMLIIFIGEPDLMFFLIIVIDLIDKVVLLIRVTESDHVHAITIVLLFLRLRLHHQCLLL